MADSELRAKGRAMRRKLMGDAYADKLDGSVYRDPIMEKFAEVTQETIFGTLWTRPGLDLKTRSLISSPEELIMHPRVQSALNEKIAIDTASQNPLSPLIPKIYC